MRKVVPHLAVLEQRDVEQVGGPTAGTKLPPGAPPEVAEAAGAIFALGADRATRLEPPKTGEAPLVMASVHGGISGSTAAINEAVEDCAEKKVEKLRAAQGIEKHLFIWIPQAAAGIELAMATLGTPASAPTLPEGIDVVWMAYGWAWRLDIFGGCHRLVAGSSYSPEPNRGRRGRHFVGARDGSYYRFVTAPDTPGGGIQYRLDSLLGGSEDRL